MSGHVIYESRLELTRHVPDSRDLQVRAGNRDEDRRDSGKSEDVAYRVMAAR
jgi:hypothetical protein